jgi:hypothetical protein
MLLSCPVWGEIAGVDPSPKWSINSTILSKRRHLIFALERYLQGVLQNSRLNFLQKIMSEIKRNLKHFQY